MSGGGIALAATLPLAESMASQQVVGRAARGEYSIRVLRGQDLQQLLGAVGAPTASQGEESPHNYGRCLVRTGPCAMGAVPKPGRAFLLKALDPFVADLAAHAIAAAELGKAEAVTLVVLDEARAHFHG